MLKGEKIKLRSTVYLVMDTDRGNIYHEYYPCIVPNTTFYTFLLKITTYIAIVRVFKKSTQAKQT